MQMIAAVDRKWGIGRDGGLLVRIPEDMRHFRRTTEGGVVVLGHRTLSTFPGGRPLKDRENIILSRDPSLVVEGAAVCHSVDEALQLIRQYEAAGQRVFVIGGATIYQQFAPYCAGAILTELDGEWAADCFFPDLLGMGWRRGEVLGQGSQEGLQFSFARYENPQPVDK